MGPSVRLFLIMPLMKKRIRLIIVCHAFCQGLIAQSVENEVFQFFDPTNDEMADTLSYLHLTGIDADTFQWQHHIEESREILHYRRPKTGPPEGFLVEDIYQIQTIDEEGKTEIYVWRDDLGIAYLEEDIPRVFERSDEGEAGQFNLVYLKRQREEPTQFTVIWSEGSGESALQIGERELPPGKMVVFLQDQFGQTRMIRAINVIEVPSGDSGIKRVVEIVVEFR